MEKNWLKIRNEASGTTADIFLMDVIDDWFGIGKNSFISAIRDSGAQNLNVHISSPGGNVDDALAMYEYLKGFSGNTTAILTGIVASAATVIALGAKKVQMAKSALFMIHNPIAGVYGNAAEMRTQADLNDKVEGQIIDIYKARTNANGKNLKTSQIKSMLDAETWMTAQEALDNGFVDEIITSGAKMQDAKLSAIYNMGYKHIPENIKDLFDNNNSDNMKEEFENLKAFIAGLFQSKATSEVTEVKILDNEEVQAKLADMENKVNAIAAKDATIADLTASIEAKDTEIATLTAEVARLSATGVSQTAKADTEPGKQKQPNPVWAAEAKAMFDEMSPLEREKFKA